MKLTTTNQLDAAKKVAELITQGINAWFEAGRIVAEQVDENEGFVDFVCEKFPSFTPEMVMRFYAIGKKQIHPELLISDAPGIRRLIKLPYGLQEKYLRTPIPVLVKTQRDWEMLQIDVRNLTADQAKQAIDGDCVRSQAAQRAWIESNNVKRFNPSADIDLPWKIVGKRLVIKKDVTLTARELARILSDMEN